VNFQALPSRFCRTVRPVGHGPGGLLDGEADPALRLGGLELGGDGGGLSAQVDRLEADLGPGEAGEVQEGSDELAHLLAGGLDLLSAGPGRVAEGRTVLFQQDGAVVVHGSQGGAQVVGDRVGEGLQVLVGLLQLVGVLVVGDALLECVAALFVAAGVEGVLGVLALAVLSRLGLVLGVAGILPLGVGLDVDLVLGVARIAALGIGPVLGMAGVTALAVDCADGLLLILLKRFADLTVAAVAGGRRPGCSGPPVLWCPGHVSHPPASPEGPDVPGRCLAGTYPPRSRAGGCPLVCASRPALRPESTNPLLIVQFSIRRVA